MIVKKHSGFLNRLVVPTKLGELQKKPKNDDTNKKEQDRKG